MQPLYVSTRYLLVGYVFCTMGWIMEDYTPLAPAWNMYLKAAYMACYVLMMHFVTLAISSLQKKSKTLRLAGWFIVVAVILLIWTLLVPTEKQQDLIDNVAGCFSFMAGYYIVVEYSKIIEETGFTKAKQFAHLIRGGVKFADLFFMLLLVPIILSVFPHVTNALVDVDLYIYYVVWIFFLVFLLLCIIEMKKELKLQATGQVTKGE